MAILKIKQANGAWLSVEDPTALHVNNPQTLDADQQEKVRQAIGAASSGDLSGGLGTKLDLPEDPRNFDGDEINRIYFGDSNSTVSVLKGIQYSPNDTIISTFAISTSPDEQWQGTGNLTQTNFNETIIVAREGRSGQIKVPETPIADNDATSKKYVDDNFVSEEDFTSFVENDLVGKKIEDGGEVFNDYENNTATGQHSHAEGSYTTASGSYSHAEGMGTAAAVSTSHAEGNSTRSLGEASHAEGNSTYATGNGSHAEGDSTTAEAYAAHAEGYGTLASESCAHAEGYATIASGQYSHTEGEGSTADGQSSHAEGYYAKASGSASHAEGYGTIAKTKAQHVSGEYNIEDPSTSPAANRGTYIHIVGNGTGDGTFRSNAHTLDWNGNAWYSGNIRLKGKSYNDENSRLVATIDQLTMDDDQKIMIYDGARQILVKSDYTIPSLITEILKQADAQTKAYVAWYMSTLVDEEENETGVTTNIEAPESGINTTQNDAGGDTLDIG